MIKYQLFGEFSKDIWDLSLIEENDLKSKFTTSTEKYRLLDFSKIHNENLKKDLKFFMRELLLDPNYSVYNLKYHYFPHLNDLIEKTSVQKESSIDELDIDSNFLRKFIEDRERRSMSNLKEYDIWYFKDFQVAEKRINKSSYSKSISFKSITNDINKQIIKDFVEDKIKNSDFSLSYIRKMFSNVLEFEKLIQKDFSSLTRSDIDNYLYYIKDQSKDLRSSKIGKIKSLTNFLLSKGIIQDALFTPYDKAHVGKQLKIRLVEKETVHQIYENLDSLEPMIRNMFLLLSNCGMRISEVMLLDLYCLEKTKLGTFLKIYQQKMRKFITNPIPEELYNILKEQQENTISKFGNDNNYLFSLKKKNPINPTYFTKRMKSFCLSNEIKKSNGEIYDFKCHDFRHTFATNLLEKDVPYHIIQRMLGHKSIEMTMSYTEIDDKRRKEKYKKFINTKGERKSLQGDINVSDEDFELQWLKKNINYQTLPNGMCALPLAMGTCPHSNSCLTCEKYFRTSIEHKEVLEKQLQKTREIIEISEEKGWIRQVSNNKKIEENLVRILENLE